MGEKLEITSKVYLSLLIDEYYIPIEKYRQLEESCVSKESIKSILNKYGKKPIDEAVNFYKEIEELLGDE